MPTSTGQVDPAVLHGCALSPLPLYPSEQTHAHHAGSEALLPVVFPPTVSFLMDFSFSVWLASAYKLIRLRDGALLSTCCMQITVLSTEN